MQRFAVIGFTGKAGSGKDTAAAYLKSKGFTQLAFASGLKNMLAAVGMPEPLDRDEKERVIEGFDFTWREAAQKLGTEWGRKLDKDIWVKILRKQMETQCGLFVISDVRFENEANMIRKCGGLVVHISGREVDLGANAGHTSEAGVEFVQGDEVIVNDCDVSYLYMQSRAYAEQLLLGADIGDTLRIRKVLEKLSNG